MWLPCVLLAVTVLSPNRTPLLGQLGSYYFETSGQSQIWINIMPQSQKLGSAPIRLNITVTFPGHSLSLAPPEVEVRAEMADSGAFPLTMRRPILRFQSERGGQIDLAAPQNGFSFISSCQDCPLDTVLARMPFDRFRQLVQEGSVELDALGFSVRLAAEDLTALRRFVEVVGNGARIQ